MKENKASVTIQASPSEVWSVLTDFDSYHEWNPMFTSAKGKPAMGESLSIKVRLPRRVFCGAPLSSAWSPRITKLEPNSCLEWFTPAGLKGFVDGTHYFQLASTHNGTATEFTQGERYTGWGTGLYSSFVTMEDARRGFVAMNNALQIETLRRRQVEDLAEKTGSAAGGDDKGTKEASDSEIAQLDISDHAAVAAIAVTSTATTVAANRNHNREESVSEKEARASDVSASGAPPAAFLEGVQEPAAPAAPAPEKPVEKRTSIIGAVSSLFSSSKSPSTSADRLPQSSSKDDLISKAVTEESEENLNDQENNNEDGDDHDVEDGGDKGGVHGVEDPEAKRAREAKNAERIELDLGSGDLSLGDFGI